MKKKYVFIKAHDNFKVGDSVELTAEQSVPMLEADLVITATEWQAQETIKATAAAAKTASETKIKDAIFKAKADGKIEPKDETVQAARLKQLEAGNDADLIVEAINALPVKAKKNLSGRTTSSDDKIIGRVQVGDIGLDETIKGYFKAVEPDLKERPNGGLIRSGRNQARVIEDAMVRAREKSERLSEIIAMVRGGGNFRFDENLVQAADYADAAGQLGVLNADLVLMWNLGFLENQLAVLSDITTDISNTPVLFQQQAMTRYIKVPGVQLKTNTNSWSASVGNDVNVNVLMSNYAGVPITINQFTLGTTARPLFNEQYQPQLYGLAEYILYTVINNIVNGNTRIANNGTSTSTITFNPGYTSPSLNAPAFNVAGATLATFVASLPAAMDEAKFPGGDEAPGDSNLMRFAFVHTTVYSQIAQDTNFLLNQSIQGISQNSNENIIQTGRFLRIGNTKFYKSQLMTDQIGTTGSGADGSTNAMFVTAGNAANAAIVGLAGTRSSLLFVSRAPLDYTKVMPEIPSTAAIELVASPKLGLTFMTVKYLDHGAENANARVQLMWGTGIGDERQGMPLRQK